MDFQVRSYTPDDYKRLIRLYKDSSLYGGVFDEARDGEEKLKRRIELDPDAILVAERQGGLVGTVSLIEDGRVAWLFRFAVAREPDETEVSRRLLECALDALKQKGHDQVLVYTPVGNQGLNNRYESLGFTKGSDYTCYYMDM